MAIVTATRSGQEAAFYNVPDDVLAKYKIEKSELKPDQMQKVIGKAEASREDASGVMPAAQMTGDTGDVQGYSVWICYYETATTIYWWYC